MMTAFTSYPPNWPDTPFHSGELQLQERFGVRDFVHSYAPRVVRPFLPEQHIEFYKNLPFLVVAARDDQGNMWASLLMHSEGTAGFVTSPTPTSLLIDARPVPGDALATSLAAGTDLGILGIDFATKRRNRVNGHLTHSNSTNNNGIIMFQVDQSFGNCPQYIHPRSWWTAHPPKQDHTRGRAPAVVRSDRLTRVQMERIQTSDTLFIATGYRGEGNDVRFGNDASHRGGAPGWIDVRNPTTLFLPDYSGNNHYNSMGNIVMDNRMGVTIPQFEKGGMIQLSGRAKLHLNPDEAAVEMYPGALHVIEFSIEQVVEVPEGSLPVRWVPPGQSKRKLQVTQKIKESDDVMSFHLGPLAGDDNELWPYKPGQHLPIYLPIDGSNNNNTNNKLLMRTYSLSSAGTGGGRAYRISVKREPLGQASRYLHDTIQVGDTIQVSEPAGDFILDHDSHKTLVLISTGIGITPILAMLHSVVLQSQRQRQSQQQQRRKVIWVHGARDGKHHPFQAEILDLVSKYAAATTTTTTGVEFLKTHIRYSQPRVEDFGYDSTGHVDVDLLKALVAPDLDNADYYMCGTAAFMADMEDGLQKLGVPHHQIHYETF